jgi:hypothetical protein
MYQWSSSVDWSLVRRWAALAVALKLRSLLPADEHRQLRVNDSNGSTRHVTIPRQLEDQDEAKDHAVNRFVSGDECTVEWLRLGAFGEREF